MLYVEVAQVFDIYVYIPLIEIGSMQYLAHMALIQEHVLLALFSLFSIIFLVLH